LTAAAGVVLIVLLAALGVTILRIRQLISVHLFVGLLLLGPVAVKLGSTGYRFVRCYTNDPRYLAKGPPQLLMRAIAPLVVISTLVVFASGIVLLFEGPARRGAWAGIHKASFVVWVIFTGLHVLGHLEGMPASLRAGRTRAELAHGSAGAILGGRPPGSAGRWLALGGALAGGLVLAVVLIPHFAPWTAAGAFPHHEH
jgi:hypothetical protein